MQKEAFLPYSGTKCFVCARFGFYNLLSLSSGGVRAAPVVGLIELEVDREGTFLTRLSLVAQDLFPGRTSDSHAVAGFLRLDGGALAVVPGEGAIDAEIPLLFGVAETDEDLKYFSRPVSARADFRYAGSTLTGTLAGRLPEDFAYAPGAEFSLPVLGIANGFGRFIARFRHEGSFDSTCLTVAGEGWRRQIHNPDEVDILIPSHSTVWLDWAKRLPDGSVRRERDVIADVILAPGQSTDLEFTLFEPASLPVLSAVLLAQERGADASLSYELREAADGSGTVEIDTVVEGRGGRYVLIDMIVASNDTTRANPQISEMGYFGGAVAGAIPISCDLKPPGPNSPGSQPVLTNPPGGAGGVDDAGGGGSTPSPNSSTSDGGNSCDANYGVVLPPNGRLALATRVKPIGKNRSEIAFVGVFEADHKLNVGRVALRSEGGLEDLREVHPMWLVPRAIHRLFVDIPRDRTLRDVTTLEIAVDTRERLISAVTLYRPSRRDVAEGRPIVLGDLGSGLAFRLMEFSEGAQSTRIVLRNESGGWIAVPDVGTRGIAIDLQRNDGTSTRCEDELMTRSHLYGVLYLILFVPVGIEVVCLKK